MHHNVVTTGCLYCTGRVTGPTPRDSVQHMLEPYPYLTPLRDLLTKLWTAFPWATGAPRFAPYLAYGVTMKPTDHAVAVAIRGALLEVVRFKPA